MTTQRITKRTVDALQSNGSEFTVWDDTVSGFGVRVRPTGAKSYVVVYRAGAGRGAPVRRYTIAAVGKITPERARARAKVILGAVAHGHDPADQKTAERGAPTVAELADRFMADHVRAKRKAGTAEFYRDILDRIVKPAVGTTKADKLTRLQVGRLHSSLADTPFQANRVLAVVGSMYAFAGRAGIVPEGTNPARGIDKFKESRRERFLTGEELERLGSAIREAETTGIPWTVDESKPNAKHLPKAAKRFTKINPFAAAALRLLAVHRLPTAGNSQPAVGACRSGARLSVPARQQERQKDRHPQCPCPCGAERAGTGWTLRGARRRSGTAAPRPQTSVGCRHQTRRIDWRSPARSAAHLRELRCRWRAGPADHWPVARTHSGSDHRTLCAPRQRSAAARLRGHCGTNCSSTGGQVLPCRGAASTTG